jgi:hypothetical protein
MKVIFMLWKSIFDEIFDFPRVFLGAEQDSAVINCPRFWGYGQKWLKILYRFMYIPLLGVTFEHQQFLQIRVTMSKSP